MWLPTALVLVGTGSTIASRDWTSIQGWDNGCKFKVGDQPETWFHAVRHCFEEENEAVLAPVRSLSEGRVLHEVVGGVQAWTMGFYDNDSWNFDNTGERLWQPEEPVSNFVSEGMFCAKQGSASIETPLLAAESCSVKLPFICMKCPTQSAYSAINHDRHESRSARSDHAGETTTTTTTPAPERAGGANLEGPIDTTTTTTTAAPDRAGNDNLEGGKATTTTTSTDGLDFVIDDGSTLPDDPRIDDNEPTVAPAATTEAAAGDLAPVANEGNAISVESSSSAAGTSTLLIAGVASGCVLVLAVLGARATYVRRSQLPSSDRAGLEALDFDEYQGGQPPKDEPTWDNTL